MNPFFEADVITPDIGNGTRKIFTQVSKYGKRLTFIRCPIAEYYIAALGQDRIVNHIYILHAELLITGISQCNSSQFVIPDRKAGLEAITVSGEFLARDLPCSS
jgi:hypothetical protein